MRYTREELQAMPILQLRGIDIKDKEEETLIQEIVNARLADMPVEHPINLTSLQTDNLTPEKEAALQAEIDERNAGIKAQFEPTEPGPLPDPTAVPVEPVAPAVEPEPAPVEVPPTTEEKEPLSPEADEEISLEKLSAKKPVASK